MQLCGRKRCSTDRAWWTAVDSTIALRIYRVPLLRLFGLGGSPGRRSGAAACVFAAVVQEVGGLKPRSAMIFSPRSRGALVACRTSGASSARCFLQFRSVAPESPLELASGLARSNENVRIRARVWANTGELI